MNSKIAVIWKFSRHVTPLISHDNAREIRDTKNKLVVVRGTNTRGQISGYAWELIIGTHVAAFLIKTSNSTHHLCLIQNCSSINSFL